MPQEKHKGFGYTTGSLLLINATPLITWIIMSAGSANTESILAIFTALPLIQMAATVFAGVMNILRCVKLKHFGLFMGILLISSAGGAYLSGIMWHYFVSSDWLTMPMTYLYMAVFAITVGIIALIGGITIFQDISRKKEK